MIVVTDRKGCILATIENGIWLEENINLSKAVYNCIIEAHTKPRKDRWGFRESIKLIKEGKGDQLKKQIENGYKNIMKRHREYMKGYYRAEIETGKDYTSSLPTRLD